MSNVFSVVRRSRMWCPYEIGRDSWDRVEQESLKIIYSPQKGEEAHRREDLLSKGNGSSPSSNYCCCMVVVS